MKLTLIAAMTNNRVIGKNNDLPWHCPEDLLFFKNKTINSTIYMGYNTWESLPIKPLPKRKNVIIKDELDFVEDGYLIGGAKSYEKYMHLCTDAITRTFDIEVEGDVFFPKLSSNFILHKVIKEKVNFNNQQIDSYIRIYLNESRNI